MNDQFKVIEGGGEDIAHIPIHGPEDYEGMRRAGRLAAEMLDFITPHVRPGVTTAELDRRFTPVRGAGLGRPNAPTRMATDGAKPSAPTNL